ncbi:hypothetical protein [Litoreibacter roseus]|uniref:Uncharacterized protein n=1 Tax=Litoreibacter roseus TaxID=2601869 RepID=A0A6N6JI93_9RHOB|nr:hypothetical protein [Litoreibacter roseus]GFE65540.1 hypothetical protein KIN_26140 [Litoreibacter roseus]
MDEVTEGTDAVEKIVQRRSFRSIEIDTKRYDAYLEDASLTASERAEVLKALWTIVSGFVELGFEVHPAQQAACGKVENSLDRDGNSDSTEVQSDQHKDEEKTDVPAP